MTGQRNFRLDPPASVSTTRFDGSWSSSEVTFEYGCSTVDKDMAHSYCRFASRETQTNTLVPSSGFRQVITSSRSAFTIED
jgi:hypothetical protein